MKKLFVLVFAIALCLGALCFGASADHLIELEKPEGAGTEDNPYKISQDGHLYWFADYVNKGNTGACAVMTQDIYINVNVLLSNGNLNDVPPNEWIPIDNFSGAFDGQGYTIHGLYLSETIETENGESDPGGRYYTGMFREISGTVKDLNLVDSYVASNLKIKGNNAYPYIAFVGGICGRICQGATVSDCNFTGTLYATVPSSVGSGDITRTGAGGICGYNEGKLTDCEFNGQLTVNNEIKQIANSGIASSYGGGICGWNHGTVERCDNRGTITGMGYNPSTGGICAYNNSDGVNTIYNCTNYGEVSAATEGGEGYTCYAGGIFGYSVGRVTINYCNNNGSITGANYAGGIAGRFNGEIISCTNSGDVEAYYQAAGGICAFASGNWTIISGCTNNAEVKITDRSPGGTTYLGGICGKMYCTGPKVVNCYNTGNLTGVQENADTMYIGGICGGMDKGTLNDPTNSYIWNSCNTGSISYNTPDDDTVTVGGVCGVLGEYGKVDNCFWLDRDGTGDEDTGAMTAERFERGEAAGSLNGWTHGEYNGKVWKVGDDGYPVLAGGSNDVVEVQFRNPSGNVLLMLCCTNKGEKLKGIDSIDESTRMLYDAGDSGVYAITVSELKEMTFSSDAEILLPQGMKQVLTVTVKGTASKVYDGSNAVTDASDLSLELSGIMIGDDVSATAESYIFDDKNAGSRTIIAQDISLIGSDAENYVVYQKTEATGVVERRIVKASITGTAAKEYDGTTNVPAGHGLSIDLEDVVDGDKVSATAASYAYGDANVGRNKTITATGITLAGEDAGNYAISFASVSDEVGTITKKTLIPSISGTVSKVYDGTTGVPDGHGLSIDLEGVINGESVSATAESYAYGDASAGENKTITATGITLAGEDAGNYAVSSASVSDEVGTITKKTLTPSFSGTVSKEYDGTTDVPVGQGLSIALEGAIDGDEVSATAAYAFDDANVGENKTITATDITLTGADAGNYVLSATEVSGSVGAITLKKVIITAEDKSAYMGDAMPGLSYKVEGFLDDDGLTVEPVLSCDADMTRAGTYEITVSGGAANSKYELVYKSGTLTVKLSWVMTVRPANGAADVVYYIHPGDSFELPDAPKNSGYIFLGWRSGDTTYRAGDEVDITSDMTFTAVWGNLPDVSEPEEQPEPELPFYDVTKGDWFYDAVKYVYYADLMDGVEEHIFAPNDTLTRAMVWTIIARAEGVDTSGGATWYAKAQDWVVGKGISDGTEPNAPITREQLVTMLWRLAGEPALGSGINAPDAGSVSSWAQQAMSWAMYTGLIEGDENGAVTPAATATRAQAAAIMMRYLEP